MSNSLQPHRWQPTRLPHPWDSPGKNTGVGCHFLLQCVKSESEVAQSYLTLSDPMDCSLPGSYLLLLLLLSHFSRVRLCATPEMAAHQAPPSLGLSRQEHWSGLSFPSPMHESESESENEVAQSCPTPSDPMDCSLPGSSIHGIFQARVLEWGAIAFSAPALQTDSLPESGARLSHQV